MNRATQPKDAGATPMQHQPHQQGHHHTPPVVDAQVVEERPAAHSHQHHQPHHADEAAGGLHKGLLASVAVVGLAVWGLYGLVSSTGPAPAHAAATMPDVPQPYTAPTQPAQNQLAYAQDTVAAPGARAGQQMDSLNQQMADLQGMLGRMNNVISDQRKLSSMQYDLYRKKLMSQGLTEAEARSYMLQAGYHLPPPPPPAQAKPQPHHLSGLDMARKVAGALVEDEVDSFLTKVRVATEVGAYIATDGKDDGGSK